MDHYIYKISSSKTDKIYIGSTNNKYRYSEHTSRYTKGLLCENSKKLFDLGIDECSFEIIETFKCNSYEEQLDKEQYYLDKFKDTVINQNRAKGLPKKEQNKRYYDNNREKIIKYQNDPKQVEQRNKLEKERQKVYYHCSTCNKEVKKRNKARHEKQKTHINALHI
tara:strand:- start:8075 stop:8572 length:498 start_codon:yes stop_codon:yes gene_type:complete